MHAALPSRVELRETLRLWLHGDGRWLTVTGEPGIGKSHLIQSVLEDPSQNSELLVLDPAPYEEIERAQGARVLAVSAARGLAPDEEVIEVKPLPLDEAVSLFYGAAAKFGATPSDDLELARQVVMHAGGNPQGSNGVK